MDYEWFMDQIRESQYGSQRELAKHFRAASGKKINQSNLSRMLTGERQMQLDEAVQFSKLLNQPLLEILARAGLSIPAPDALIRACEFYGSGGKDDGSRARSALKAWRS